jgi:hypothetical protein
MGRELKRVPLDFDWPIGKTWKGYDNPHHGKCPECDGRGNTTSMKALETIAQLLMVAGEDSLKRPPDFKPTGRCIDIPTYPGSPHKRHYPHPYLVEASIYDVGDSFHELSTGLAGRPPGTFGHDSLDNWAAVKAIIKAAGLDPKVWGVCPACEGYGVPPAIRAAQEAWQEYEPPTGDGYQLWQSTSEGSPVSPVFDSLDALCSWAAENATVFADIKVSAAEWKQMFGSGLVCHQEGNVTFL